MISKIGSPVFFVKSVIVHITIIIVDIKPDCFSKCTVYFPLKHNNKIKIYPVKGSVENDAGTWVKISTLFN